MAERKRRYYLHEVPLYINSAGELLDLLHRGWQLMPTRTHHIAYKEGRDGNIEGSRDIPERVYLAAGGDAGVADFQGLERPAQLDRLLALMPERGQPPTEASLSYAELVARDVATLPKAQRQVRPKLNKDH